MNANGKPARDSAANWLWEQIALLRNAGVDVTADYLLSRIDVGQAAEFLGTTPGEIYNLTSRREIPFYKLGKRGVRFCRLDLIQWLRQLH